jgi:hypothetical protein
VVRVLEEKLTRQPEKPVVPLNDAERERRMAEIQKIVAEFNQLPVLDNRTPEEMLYDDDGLPA